MATNEKNSNEKDIDTSISGTSNAQISEARIKMAILRYRRITEKGKLSKQEPEIAVNG